MDHGHPPVEMIEVTNPEECANAHAQFRQFDCNWEWFQQHASDVYSKYRGKHICIAGQELFVADTAEEAMALAQAAHPNDRGRFVRYIPREKVARVYAPRR